MLEDHIRPRYQRLLVDPIARQLTISPNAVTLAALILGIFVPIAIVSHHPVAAIFLLLFSGYCDTLDGTLARMQNHSTAAGSVFDIVADRCVEFAVVFGLYLYAPQQRATYALLMLGAILICVTSFLVVGIFSDETSEKSFYYSPGLMERPEAFAFFIAMIALPLYFVPLALGFIGLVGVTAVIRVAEFCQRTSSCE